MEAAQGEESSKSKAQSSREVPG